MAAIQDPNLGLFYGWSYRESGWKTGMDSNLKRVGALLHLSVKSRALTTPPGSPAAGDRYWIPTGGTGAWSGHDHEVTIYREGAWAFEAIAMGALCFDESDGLTYSYSGSTWTHVGAGSGAYLDLAGTAKMSGPVKLSTDTYPDRWWYLNPEGLNNNTLIMSAHFLSGDYRYMKWSNGGAAYINYQAATSPEDWRVILTSIDYGSAGYLLKSIDGAGDLGWIDLFGTANTWGAAQTFLDSNGILFASGDVGLSRSAAGVIKATDGSTGYAVFDASELRIAGTSILARTNTWTGAQAVHVASDVVQFTVQGHSTQTNKLQEWKNNAGAVVASVANSGALVCAGLNAGGVIQTTDLYIWKSYSLNGTTVDGFLAAGTNPAGIAGGTPNGASAVGVILDTFNAFSTSGSKLVSIRNAGAEKAYFDKDGGLTVAGAGGNVPAVSTGTAAPASTPSKKGDLFVDYTNIKVYVATGTSSSADWTILN